MTSNHWLYLAAGLGLALLVAACGPIPQEGPPGQAVPPSQTAASPTPAGGEPASPLPTATPAQETGQTRAVPPPPEPVGSPPAPPLGSAVPADLLAAIVQDLAGRLDVDQAQIEVERAEAVVWNDGSLGCPEPGMMYTQALVDGYWVVVRHDGRSYDYRATDKGYFRLCENPSPVNPGTD